MALLYAGIYDDGPTWSGNQAAGNTTVAPYVTYWRTMVNNLTRADGSSFTFPIQPGVVVQNNPDRSWTFAKPSVNDLQAQIELDINGTTARTGQYIVGMRIDRPSVTTANVTMLSIEMGGNRIAAFNSTATEVYLEAVVDWDTLKLDIYANGTLASSRNIVTTSGQAFALMFGSASTAFAGITSMLLGTNDKFRMRDLYIIRNRTGEEKTPRMGPVTMKSSFATAVLDSGGSSSSDVDILASAKATVVSTGVYNPDTFVPIGRKAMVFQFDPEEAPAGAELKLMSLSVAGTRGDPTVASDMNMSFRGSKVGDEYPILASGVYPVGTAKGPVGPLFKTPVDYDPLKPVIIGVDIER